jgi:hypothetical protein
MVDWSAESWPKKSIEAVFFGDNVGIVEGDKLQCFITAI